MNLLHCVQYQTQRFYTIYIYIVGTLYYCNNARTLNVIKLGIV